MPNVGDGSLLKLLDPADISTAIAVQAAILAKRLCVNIISADCPERGHSGNQVRCAGFPKD
jgi:hypothetical protein